MKFAVLGTLDVTGGAGRIRLGGRRQRATLAILLATPNQPVSTSQLVEAVWGGRAPRTAADNLRLYIHQLRRLLGEDRLVRHPGGYAIVVLPDELDADRFENLYNSGRALLAGSDARSASDVFREALALWRGPAYADVDEVAAVRAEAARLEQQRLAVFEAHFDADLALGRYAVVVPELSQRVAENPLRERLRVQLMVALHHDGRPAEALAVYQEGRRALADELGLDPGPELVRAHQAILTGQFLDLEGGLESAGPSGAQRPVDVDGRSDPDEPAESEGPADPAELSDPPELADPPSTAWPTPSLLPPDIPDFTGRDIALGLAQRLLTGHPEALAVVGIAGMAGLGKTALAVHVAHQRAGSYPDGQLFANLRGAEAEPVDPADVLARFLRSMGVSSRAIPVDLVERTELYRSHLAGRRVLVVLDNAVSEEQVRPLLPGAASCAVLITSRARLNGIEGAGWIDLEQFRPEQAIQLLSKIASGGRTEAEPADAAAIVALCGYLPLAVRIAGARLTARSSWRLAHLVGMLRDERRRLDQLAAGDLEVRASLAISYDNLDEPCRRLFRRLGLFDAPDFPSWLAAAVLDAPMHRATGYVEALVDAQLLAGAGIDSAGQVRYRFHDLVRLYARERAEIEDGDDDRAAALAAGLGGWLAIAERMAPDVPGPCFAAIHGSAVRPEIGPDHGEILAIEPLSWFDAERLGMLSAVGQACRLGMDELAFDLAGCLEKYFDVRGMYEDWQATDEQVMTVCEAAGNLRGQAVMLRGLIDVVTWNGQDDTGPAMIRLHDDASRLLEMFTRLDERPGMADALVMCSWGLTARGEFGPAVETAQQALELAEQCGHLGGRPRAEVAIAVALGQSGQVADAIDHLNRALTQARDLGNPRYVAAVLQFLGMAHLEFGDLAASHRVLMESLEISRKYRDHYTETLSMVVLARVHLKRGDPRARTAAEASLALGRQHAMTHHIADSLAILGQLEMAEGHPARAVGYLTESVELWRTRGWPQFLAAALESLGGALAGTDRPAALGAWTEAREIFGKLGQDGKVDDLTRLIERCA